MPKRNARLAAAVAASGRFGYVIAAEARVNPARFSRIITGNETPSDAAKQRIANALGISAGQLFDDEPLAIPA